MINKEQYEMLTPYRKHLDVFRRTGGEYTGSHEVFNIHKSITGRQTNTSCPGCRAATLLELNMMIAKYEGSM